MSSIAGSEHSEQTVTHEYATQSIFRPFPMPQTARQIFYLLFLQGFGAGIIDFGANFAIAYGMYAGQTDVRLHLRLLELELLHFFPPSFVADIQMWVMSKNTVAGDLGVTPIIQTAVSMLISSTLVHTDLHHHAIQPLPFVYPHVEHLPDPRELFDRMFKRKHRTAEDEVLEQKRAMHNNKYGKRGWRYYFWMLVRFMFEGTEMNMIVARCGPRAWPLRVIWTAAQGALLGIVLGFPIWCLAIVILGPIYGTGNMGNKWAPQAIKGVYGCIVGWVTNPVIAALALGSQADHHIVVVPVDDGETGQPVENMNTIMEEGEEGCVSPHHVGNGLAPPSPQFTRPRAGTTGTNGSQRSRSGSIILLQSNRLTPTRSRSNSTVTILRPPLTTNVSQLTLPSATAATPRTPGARARGGTVSSTVSGTVTPSSMCSYQYALGGHGGRAKRSRRNTTAMLPDSTILGLGRPAEGQVQAEPKPRVTSASASSETSPHLPVPHYQRPRGNSDVAGGAAHAHALPHADLGRISSFDCPPGHDVFGDTSDTVPMLRIQRASLDAAGAHARSASGTNSNSSGSNPTSNARRDSCEGPLGELRE